MADLCERFTATTKAGDDYVLSLPPIEDSFGIIPERFYCLTHGWRDATHFGRTTDG